LIIRQEVRKADLSCKFCVIGNKNYRTKLYLAIVVTHFFWGWSAKHVATKVSFS